MFDNRHYSSQNVFSLKNDFGTAEIERFVASFTLGRFSLNEIIYSFILFQRSLPGISKAHLHHAWRRLFVACLVQADELVNGTRSRPDEYYSAIWLQTTNKSMGKLEGLDLLLSELNAAVLPENNLITTANVSEWCVDIQRVYFENYSKRIEFTNNGS